MCNSIITYWVVVLKLLVNNLINFPWKKNEYDNLQKKNLFILEYDSTKEPSWALESLLYHLGETKNNCIGYMSKS